MPKNKKRLYLLIVMGGIFFLPFFVFGSQGGLIINEIAWMGTENSAGDEWIELHNITDLDIDSAGWTLKSIDGTPEISLNGIIPAQGYFLLERTDDNSVADIPADQIYTGSLGNNGEELELYDNQNNLIDYLDCSGGWPAGDNSTKQTMERTADGWQNSQEAGGTPKSKNSSPNQEDGEEPTNSPQETGSKFISPASNYPPSAQAGPDITTITNQEIIFDASSSSDPDMDILNYFWNFGDGATCAEATTGHSYASAGQYIVTLEVDDGQFSDLDTLIVNTYSQSIIISEFIPDPEGLDRENEWIEIHNQSSQIANLTGWQLDDQEGGSRPFIFPKNSLIAPNQFLVLKRPLTKLALNNDEDMVRLIYPNGEIASQVSYSGKDKKGQSIAFDGNYYWTTLTTPGAVNIISSDKAERKENLSDNPELNIQKSQELPEELTIKLTDANSFSTQDSPDNPKDILRPATMSLLEETGNLAAQSNKANLILILSIVISGLLLVVWVLRFFH